MMKKLKPPVEREMNDTVHLDDPDAMDERIEALEKRSRFRFRTLARWAFGLLGFAVSVVYIAHLLIPESWAWLNKDQISELKNLFVTIVVGLLMAHGVDGLFKK